MMCVAPTCHHCEKRSGPRSDTPPKMGALISVASSGNIAAAHNNRLKVAKTHSNRGGGKVSLQVALMGHSILADLPQPTLLELSARSAACSISNSNGSRPLGPHGGHRVKRQQRAAKRGAAARGHLLLELRILSGEQRNLPLEALYLSQLVTGQRPSLDSPAREAKSDGFCHPAK